MKNLKFVIEYEQNMFVVIRNLKEMLWQKAILVNLSFLHHAVSKSFDEKTHQDITTFFKVLQQG